MHRCLHTVYIIFYCIVFTCNVHTDIMPFIHEKYIINATCQDTAHCCPLYLYWPRERLIAGIRLLGNAMINLPGLFSEKETKHNLHFRSLIWWTLPRSHWHWRILILSNYMCRNNQAYSTTSVNEVDKMGVSIRTCIKHFVGLASISQCTRTVHKNIRTIIIALVYAFFQCVMHK